MNLADSWDPKFIDVGKHKLTIKEFEIFTCHSGSEGVAFKCFRSDGLSIKASFVIHPKSIWRLASFGKACGLSKDEAALYDPENPECHAVMVGRSFIGIVEKGEKYNELTGWEKVESQEVAAPEKMESKEETPAPAPRPTQKADDEIPF